MSVLLFLASKIVYNTLKWNSTSIYWLGNTNLKIDNECKHEDEQAEICEIDSTKTYIAYDLLVANGRRRAQTCEIESIMYETIFTKKLKSRIVIYVHFKILACFELSNCQTKIRFFKEKKHLNINFWDNL